jgi:hypothetical protein
MSKSALIYDIDYHLVHSWLSQNKQKLHPHIHISTDSCLRLLRIPRLVLGNITPKFFFVRMDQYPNTEPINTATTTNHVGNHSSNSIVDRKRNYRMSYGQGENVTLLITGSNNSATTNDQATDLSQKIQCILRMGNSLTRSQ